MAGDASEKVFSHFCTFTLTSFEIHNTKEEAGFANGMVGVHSEQKPNLLLLRLELRM